MGTSWSTRLCRSLARSTFSHPFLFSSFPLFLFFMKRQRNDPKQLVQRIFFTNALGRMQRRKLYLAVGKKRSSLSLSVFTQSWCSGGNSLAVVTTGILAVRTGNFFFFFLFCALTHSLLKRRCALLVRRKRASRCVPPHWKRLTLFCPLSFVYCMPARVVLSIIEWWLLNQRDALWHMQNSSWPKVLPTPPLLM